MSNKNNDSNSIKQKYLVEKLNLEKKKMLLQMQKEIIKLETEIKYFRFANIKISIIRGLKILIRTGKLTVPFIVMAGITFSGFSLIGATPFYKDKNKQKLNTIKEIDSLGNIRYEQQYQEYKNNNNIISYYSKWNYIDDNFYSRDIEVYNLKDITEEQILKLINDNVKSLKEILGEPISKKTEIKNNLTEEQLKQDSFLQAKIYSIVDDNFIEIEETTKENTTMTFLYFLITLIGEIPLVLGINSCDYNCYIRTIKEKYPFINVEELNKKLEIKRSNYNRLTR